MGSIGLCTVCSSWNLVHGSSLLLVHLVRVGMLTSDSQCHDTAAMAGRRSRGRRREQAKTATCGGLITDVIGALVLLLTAPLFLFGGFVMVFFYHVETLDIASPCAQPRSLNVTSRSQGSVPRGTICSASSPAVAPTSSTPALRIGNTSTAGRTTPCLTLAVRGSLRLAVLVPWRLPPQAWWCTPMVAWQ